MADGLKQSRKNSSHETLESTLTEDRYESLQSIQRLLDSDAKAIIQSRATSLPSLTVGGSKVFSRRRASELADYMQRLAHVRNKVIDGLLPSIEQTSPSDEINTLASCLRKRRLKLKPRLDDREEDEDSEHEAIDKCIQVDESDLHDIITDKDTNDGKCSVDELFELPEYNYAHRASIRDDDFQQFLGVRYLEICHKRKGSKGKEKIFNESVSSKSIRRQTNSNNINLSSYLSANRNKPPSTLNLKLLSLAHSKRRLSYEKYKDRVFTVSKKGVRLPPILSGRGVRRGKNSDGDDKLKEGGQEYSDPCSHETPCSVSMQKARRGVPCHAEGRARTRYTGRLHALLNKFRDVSSTSQKVDQEKLIDNLDEIQTKGDQMTS